ncbi:hypothetical protein GCM10020331_012980 [Ectobacillus funiculus]
MKFNQFKVGDTIVRQGDMITIDGSTGEIMLGEVQMIEPQLSDEFQMLLAWADQERKLDVRANADNPEDAKKSARVWGCWNWIMPYRAYVYGRNSSAHRSRYDTCRNV